MPIPIIAITLFASLCCSLTQPPTKAPPPGPGDPLPRFELKAGNLSEYSKDALIVEGGFELLWGDLQIRGDRFRFDRVNLRLEVSGKVLIERGDEVLRGESLSADGKAGTFELRQASADSPPFSFQGERILRSPTTIRVEEGSVFLGSGGSGEIRVRAKTIRLENSGRLILNNATLYLYRRPFFRLRYLSLPIDTTKDNSRHTRSNAPPITFRVSQISGMTFGIGSDFTVNRNLTGSFLTEFSTRQRLQFQANAGSTLIGSGATPPPRRLLRLPGEIVNRPGVVQTTPLRQMLTARPLPTKPQPVLDYTNILTTGISLSRPTRTTERRVSIEANVVSNREFAGSRFGPLLTSALPEMTMQATIPLRPLPASVDWNDNESALHHLRVPRFYLRTTVNAGEYREVRLREGRNRVTERRSVGTVGIGFDPLLQGNRLLTSGELVLRSTRYTSSTTYGFSQLTLSASYIPSTGTMIGGSYIQRDVYGQTPFYFDRIDTDNEAQLRGQVGLLGGRYTLATLGRFDTKQGKLFDLEFGFAIRGMILEPRFTYHKLNGNFNFTLALPGLTP